jgi:hypothetical protein
MRRIALIALAVLIAAPARGWVFYHATVGDFVVVCWASAEGAADKRCSLTAPPQNMARRTENLLHVQEFAPDRFQIAIEMRGEPQPYAPVWLKIGARPAHETPVTHAWGRWDAAESKRILAEMAAADGLVFRVRVAPNGRPQETAVSLVGFRDALAAYRGELRRHGILRPGPAR